MSYRNCIERGLLRKIPVVKEETENQIKIAQEYIKKAEKIMDKDVYDISFLTSYISIFHSARALLYSRNYKERSHFCLFEFVRVEFKADSELSRLGEISQNYRETRHMIQYEGSLCSESSAVEAIKDAKKFLSAAKRIVFTQQGAK
ncbi:HEPN domain-containing protein [Candidatus Micrarchaeota archaeon]|nr:HEPN domain-containing protein [Candidatus Micrarchaeota archaeon]